MKVTETKLKGAYILEPRIFNDSRGYFFESYNKKTFHELGIMTEFQQDNHSYSVKGTLRGLHYQLEPMAQEKLVRVIEGEVLDFIVDIRKKSPTFGEWVSVKLSGENRKSFYVPVGFAHGFCVLSETVHFLYKCSNLYSPKDERGIIWNDPELAIDWQIENPIISERDQKNPLFKDVIDFF
ncbi:MAG: dTDP-4-dehydrorhamnose 3,5-epimerase [Nitrospinae bacterium]|nr:dTDP-4-dehydrorhamnose 3,5-epimerase [Nitrospinota bacterium]